MYSWPPAAIAALVLCLVPLGAFGLASERLTHAIDGLPFGLRLMLPALCAFPYWLAAYSRAEFSWGWLAVYLAVPVLVTLTLRQASRADPQQRGDWRDFAVLVVLGLAVDLRWFERAWPAHLAAINKMLLLDAGLYGFLAIRKLGGVGYDLRAHWSDVTVGLRELAFYAPMALALGLVLGFLHLHPHLPKASSVALAWVFTFVLIAIPEEIYFRGWMQNLLERWIGPRGSLYVTSVVFGLAHFNKRAAHFNWRYVLLATMAGIFYGRAWRAKRRVAASAITHTLVDTVWSLWL
jgi:uncharacterized protein